MTCVRNDSLWGQVVSRKLFWWNYSSPKLVDSAAHNSPFRYVYIYMCILIYIYVWVSISLCIHWYCCRSLSMSPACPKRCWDHWCEWHRDSRCIHWWHRKVEIRVGSGPRLGCNMNVLKLNNEPQSAPSFCVCLKYKWKKHRDGLWMSMMVNLNLANGTPQRMQA